MCWKETKDFNHGRENLNALKYLFNPPTETTVLQEHMGKYHIF
jgi:hypothetical protein